MWMESFSKPQITGPLKTLLTWVGLNFHRICLLYSEVVHQGVCIVHFLVIKSSYHDVTNVIEQCILWDV